MIVKNVIVVAILFINFTKSFTYVFPPLDVPRDEEDVFMSESECKDDLEKYKTEIFLMDRTNIWKPLKVLEITPTRVYYSEYGGKLD